MATASEFSDSSDISGTSPSSDSEGNLASPPGGRLERQQSLEDYIDQMKRSGKMEEYIKALKKSGSVEDYIESLKKSGTIDEYVQLLEERYHQGEMDYDKNPSSRHKKDNLQVTDVYYEPEGPKRLHRRQGDTWPRRREPDRDRSKSMIITVRDKPPVGSVNRRVRSMTLGGRLPAPRDEFPERRLSQDERVEEQEIERTSFKDKVKMRDKTIECQIERRIYLVKRTISETDYSPSQSGTTSPSGSLSPTVGSMSPVAGSVSPTMRSLSPCAGSVSPRATSPLSPLSISPPPRIYSPGGDKAGSYVALTLLGRTPGKNSPGGDNISHPLNERVSAPRSVNAEMDQEYKTQKVATIRMMYEKAANDYEKIKQELSRNPQASHLQTQLTDVGRMLKTLEQQLFELTGIPAESQQLSPGSRPIMAPVAALPPHPPPPHPGILRRYGSGDHLHQINRESVEMETVPEQSPSYNPAPWLAGGPKHRKADSMPETFYQMEDSTGAKEATVVRSHSDSRKRTSQTTLSVAEMKEGVSAEEIEKLRTTSLPSKMSEAGTSSDHSPHFSPATSPSPEGTNDDSHMGEPLFGLGLETPSPARPANSMNLTTPESRLPLHVVSPQQVDVISMEDDEFTSEGEHVKELTPRNARTAVVDEPGPFGDLNVLKHKPAHITVFLHYLISNSDPSPFFFYLVTESYPSGNMKDMRRWAYEIHSTFLINNAPLRVSVDDEIVTSIDKTLLHKYDKEDSLRMVFQNARHVAQGEISELLLDFRNKRALGLGNLYGDHFLQDDNMSKAMELQLIEKYLLPHLERFLKEESASDRSQAMASALATFLKSLGHQYQSKNASLLERCSSFTSKDKKVFRFGSKNKQKINVVKSHSFGPQHYYTVTNCNLCQNVIWGIGNQGYQCINCDYNVHKQCMDSVKETCIGRNRKDRHRKSMLDKIITRKPSSNNPVAIREAQKNLEESQPSANVTSPGGASTPTSASVFHIKRDDEDEDLDSSRKSSREDKNSDMVLSSDESRNSNSIIGSRSPDTTGDEDSKKAGSNLTRSESLNKKPEVKKNVRRTKSDVHVDENTLKALNQSGSSSNSSISGSFDNTTNSHEGSSNESTLAHAVPDNDPDLNNPETELPRLEDVIPIESLKRLKPKEKKRQEVINELFYTERSHVRNLKVMQKVFHQRMCQTEWISQDLVKWLFPNLGEMIELHDSLNSGFKAKRKENPVVGDIADILLDRFSEENGEIFKRTVAKFCRNQSLALDLLRVRMRKDTKLAAFLQELGADPLCRRLELKDLLPSGMQRLTKYPLLIDSLMKYTSANSEEYKKLQRSSELSRSILNHVNAAVKEMEDTQKLGELQRKLDRKPIENILHPVTSEYKTLDLTRHKLIHDGPLTWRIGQKKLIDLHVVLLEDILVLLQKQDEKLVLKCQSTTVVAGKEDTKFTHSPIIKLTNLLTRNVATDRRAFFLVSTSHLGPQIYELVASTMDDKNKWIKYIGDATESYKGKDVSKPRRPGTSGRPPPVPREDDAEGEMGNRKESKEENQAGMGNVIEEEEDPAGGGTSRPTSEAAALERNQSSSVDSLEQMKVIEVQQINDSELIQPNEVIVMDMPFEHAQPVLTPMEKLRRKDDIIKESLNEKRKIISDILQCPEADFDHIADVAAEVDDEKDEKALILAAVSQTNKLSELLNCALRLTEEPPANSSEGAAAAQPRWDSQSQSLMVSLPSSKMNHIQTVLNKSLQGLMKAAMNREEERDEREKLQKQLKLAQEQLAILQDTPMRSPSHSLSSRPNSFASVASSANSETADDLTDGLTNIPVVNFTQQSASYDLEQFSTVQSAASESTLSEEAGVVEKVDSMLSSVSSDSQEGEEGFHDARSDAHNTTAEGSEVPSNSDSQQLDSNDSTTSESTVGESD